MTQFVNSEDGPSPNNPKDSKGSYKGVKDSDIQTNYTQNSWASDPELTNAPQDIRSLIGIAAIISEKDIERDDRLAYILSK